MNAEQTELVFVNGTAMKGGALSHHLAHAEFLGEAATLPRYRFYSVRDEFPGLAPVDRGGASIVGELYRVDLGTISQKFLPDEPKELELSLIAVDETGYALGMILRPEFELDDETTDITDHGGWRAYLVHREAD